MGETEKKAAKKMIEHLTEEQKIKYLNGIKEAIEILLSHKEIMSAAKYEELLKMKPLINSLLTPGN